MPRSAIVKPGRTRIWTGSSRMAGIARPMVLLAVGTWGLLAIVLSMVIVVVLFSEVFPVRDIDINGELRQLQPEVIHTVAEEYTKGGFFMADVDGLQQELLRDPWVHDVVVRRRWPDTISLDIVEERAFARWRNKGFLSYSGDFFLLTDVDVLHHSLPLMSGPEQSHKEVFARYQYISEVLAPARLRVLELHSSARNSWTVKLSNGWMVHLGREKLERNLRRLVAIVNNVLTGRSSEVGVVDMRYENGYAVLWKNQLSTNSDLAVKVRGGQ